MKLLAGPQPCAGPLLSSVEGPPPAGAPPKPADAFRSSVPSCFTLPIRPGVRVCVCVCVCANRPPGEGLQWPWGGGPGSIRGGVLKADA